ncbi:MAG: DUF1015 domain-containing protein [Pelolinea sp.]|nr:DUF1015 domain-containing protein [Pelolinea sp.]
MIKNEAYQKPVFYLPKENIDLQKWAVIACDQFTSQPAYWEKVEALVGDSPSTYHLILPEAYLDTPKAEEHGRKANEFMREYMDQNLLVQQEGFVYIERDLGSKTRRGLLLNLDLEQYDFNKGSQSLIRASEGTILDRLPPRVKIREKALLELPHIMVLIDDRTDELFSYLSENKNKYQKIYDFDLMQDSGSLKGFLINNQGEEKIHSVFETLADEKEFKRKYELSKDLPPLLFAVGDGNHSLATAKSIWEKIKDHVPANHPARYAMVEIVNIHDKSLVFEPIHRVLFNFQGDIVSELQTYFKNAVEVQEMDAFATLQTRVKNAGSDQTVGLLQQNQYRLVRFTQPTTSLAVGTLQQFLDDLLKKQAGANLDYVHGDDVLNELSMKKDSTGFMLPAMQKNDFFRTVILDGSLPRKTFSMGDAREKRFYLECRRIQ